MDTQKVRELFNNATKMPKGKKIIFYEDNLKAGKSFMVLFGREVKRLYDKGYKTDICATKESLKDGTQKITLARRPLEVFMEDENGNTVPIELSPNRQKIGG